MAGTEGDLETAKEFLHLYQRELGIKIPSADPIFAAGSRESQDAILTIAQSQKPRAWIDVYYPVMNTPLDRAVQIIGDDGTVVWDADLEEYSDEDDPDAAKYRNAIPAFHGLSKGGDVTGEVN
jgi:N-acetylated-alpha-linked acidic dipeptidase